ncbi:MAG TPA: hypothetical protein VIV27_09265 [Halioglobus sp.]
MAEREKLSTHEADRSWSGQVQAVLDSYLGKIGIVSAEVRSRWAAHIIAQLQLQIGEFAADDIVEQAVERLRAAIDARLATVANLDPLRDGKEIASILVVLQDEKYAELVNSLFENCDADDAPLAQQQLRLAVAANRPYPVPDDAPINMPIQGIQLRPLNPLHWLFREPR